MGKRALNAPDGLGPAAKTMWGDITRDFDLRADELVILEQACRTLDLVERLERAITDPNSHITAKGSKGQTIVNPLTQEIRQQRACLKTLLAGLGLNNAGDTGEGSRSANARSLAMARWGTAAS